MATSVRATPRTPLWSARASAASARRSAAAAAAAAAAADTRQQLRLPFSSTGSHARLPPPSPLASRSSRHRTESSHTQRRATAPQVSARCGAQNEAAASAAAVAAAAAVGASSGVARSSTTLATPAAAAAMQKIAEQLLPEFVAMRGSFRGRDPDGLGAITLHDFQQGLRHSGVTIQGAAFDAFCRRYYAQDDDAKGGIMYAKLMANIGAMIHAGPTTTHVPSKLRTTRVAVQGFGVKVAPPLGVKHDPGAWTVEGQIASNLVKRVQGLAVAITAALGRQAVRLQLPQHAHLFHPAPGHLDTEAFVHALRGFGLKLAPYEMAGVLDQCADAAAQQEGKWGMKQPQSVSVARLFGPLLALLKPSFREPRRRRANSHVSNFVAVKPAFRKAAADKKVFYDAETALKLLGMKMYSKYRHVSDTFKLFDEDRNGSLTREEFKDRMESMGFWLTPKEFSKLMTFFDADNSGEISFSEWNNLVGRLVQPGEGGTVFFKKKGQGKKRPIKEWAEAAFMQAIVLDAGSVSAAFDLIDTDHDGSIAQSEFMRAARKYGLNMNVEQTAKLTDFYGSVNGCISKEAFVERAKYLMTRPATSGAAELEKLMQERKTPVPLVTAEQVIAVLGRKMANKFKSVHKAFMKFNPTRKHSMHPRDLRIALEQNFGMFMKDSEWTLFMERLFKSTPNDPISYKSFTHVVGELISPSSVWKAIEEMQNKHMIRLAGWVRETIIRGLIKGTGQDLRLVFRKIAGDNDVFSLADLNDAVQRTGISLSLAETQGLFAEYPTNSSGKVPFESFAPVFARLMSEVIATPMVQPSSSPVSTTRRLRATKADNPKFTATIGHIGNRTGRAMARALAKRELEATTGSIPLSRKYPVLRTNTSHHVPDAPTLDAFPNMDLTTGAQVRASNTVVGAGTPAATSASAKAKAGRTMHALRATSQVPPLKRRDGGHIHALDLGGVIMDADGVPRYPSARPIATPALSVLSADDDAVVGTGRRSSNSNSNSNSNSGGGGSSALGMAAVRTALRGGGRWRQAFKRLREADPSGSEVVTLTAFVNAMTQSGVALALAQQMKNNQQQQQQQVHQHGGGDYNDCGSGEPDVAAACRCLCELARRFPGQRTQDITPRVSTRIRSTRRSASNLVAYLRFMRKMVPNVADVVFMPTRVVPVGSRHPPSTFGRPKPLRSSRSAGALSTGGRSMDTTMFMQQSQSSVAPPSSFPQVRHEVRREWREMRAAFSKHDASRTGAVRLSTFRRVLQQFGVLLSEDELGQVAAPFLASSTQDGRARGRRKQPTVRFNEFLRAQLQPV